MRQWLMNVCAVIEDFFRLLIDALIYYHKQVIQASICEHILSAAISALGLEQAAPLIAALHYLRDFLSYGTNHPNSSSFIDPAPTQFDSDSPTIQDTVKILATAQGETLVQRILTGMMFTFPPDCFQDSSGVLLALFELMPEKTSVWVKHTISILPAGSVKVGDSEKLINSIGQKINQGEMRKVRVLLQG